MVTTTAIYSCEQLGISRTLLGGAIPSACDPAGNVLEIGFLGFLTGCIGQIDALSPRDSGQLSLVLHGVVHLLKKGILGSIEDSGDAVKIKSRWRSVDTEPSRTVAGLMLTKERIRSLADGTPKLVFRELL
jgi:hypothetical protein